MVTIIMITIIIRMMMMMIIMIMMITIIMILLLLLLGLCSGHATLSARQSLKIDVQHLLTLSGELYTPPPPPNPTSFEPLLNNLIPPTGLDAKGEPMAPGQ